MDPRNGPVKLKNAAGQLILDQVHSTFSVLFRYYFCGIKNCLCRNMVGPGMGGVGLITDP